MGASFSDLPPGVHLGVRPGWTSEVTSAVQLLGETQGAPALKSNLVPLEAMSAATVDTRRYLVERGKHVKRFVDEIIEHPARYDAKRNWEVEASVKEMLRDQFTTNGFDVDNVLFQLVLDQFLNLDEIKRPNSRMAQLFSPLVSGWAAFLCERGDENQTLILQWPNELDRSSLHLGRGMHDVSLEILGNVNGNLAIEADNCTISLDSIVGIVGSKAKYVQLTVGYIEGAVFYQASHSNLICSYLVASSSILLGEDNTVVIETAEANIKPDGLNNSKSVPCSIKIGQLDGYVHAYREWTVEVENGEVVIINPAVAYGGPDTRPVSTNIEIHEKQIPEIRTQGDELNRKLGALAMDLYNGPKPEIEQYNHRNDRYYRK